VLGSSLRCRRLGRSLGENVGDEVLGVSLGNIESLNFETLGYVLGSDDGIRLGDLPTETIDDGIWLGDLLAETLG
jgi:hypothetical protein